MNINVIIWISLGVFIVVLLLFSFWMVFGKWIKLGSKFEFNNKNKKILVGIVDKNKDISGPYFGSINSDTIVVTIGKNVKTYPYNEDSVGNNRLWGFPYVLFSDSDAQTTAGIYFKQNDEDGKPLVASLQIKGEDKPLTNQPVLLPVKPSVTIMPSFITALIKQVALTKTLQDFLEKNKQLFYIAIALLFGVGGTLYFVYTMHADQIPLLQLQIEQLAQQVQLLSEAQQ